MLLFHRRQQAEHLHAHLHNNIKINFIGISTKLRKFFLRSVCTYLNQELGQFNIT